MIVKTTLGYVNIILDLPNDLLFLLPNFCLDISKYESIDIKVYYEQEEAFFEICVNNGVIIREKCDICNAAFKLSVELEQCFCEKIEQLFIDSILFHGGLVSIDNKSIMILGKKCVGKSTLISLLMNSINAQYYSDDIIVANQLELFGAAIPQRLRFFSKQTENNIIGHGKDFSGEIRYFSLPNRICDNSIKCNVVVFPYYNEVSNNCEEVVGYKKIMYLSENIKSINGVKNIYDSLVDLALNMRMYKIQYNDATWIKNKIYQILN